MSYGGCSFPSSSGTVPTSPRQSSHHLGSPSNFHVVYEEKEIYLKCWFIEGFVSVFSLERARMLFNNRGI